MKLPVYKVCPCVCVCSVLQYSYILICLYCVHFSLIVILSVGLCLPVFVRLFLLLSKNVEQ